MAGGPIESVIRRDRWVVLSVLFAITLLSWVYLVYEARVMESMADMMKERLARGEPMS